MGSLLGGVGGEMWCVVVCCGEVRGGEGGEGRGLL